MARLKTIVLTTGVVIVAIVAGLYVAAWIRSSPIEPAAFFEPRPPATMHH